ncbi:glycosyltransferase family 4 protein [Dyadobacter tibetensis]|uniref:glycosyltransferase family 4 protein n=1 Tax=Dyadobacter tibetensis TaxID=1211851 RepID=UPI0004701248|nr:glycosyltransferase family 4 protein [Dyadobacter tibetensis]
MVRQKPPIRLLILQNSLMPYRIPLYEALAEQYDLTVAYVKGDCPAGKVSFRQLLLPTYQWSGVAWQKNLAQLCKKFHVVISMFDLHWIGYMALAFGPRPYKLILWGIGVSSQYGFNELHLFDPIRRLIAARVDGLLLYSEQARVHYISHGFPAQKLFVAPNTVATRLPATYWESHRKSERYKLLFIGSLQFRKQIESLIDSFQELADQFNQVELHIIGEGPALEALQRLANQSGFTQRIYFHGAIHSDSELAAHFHASIACISPGQAGLSVLKSFSFGVPFITRSSAITGGERFNITNGNNGILYFNDLSQVLRRLILNPTEIRRLSATAFHYYWTHRTLKSMTDGFHRAIAHTLAQP